MSTAWRFRVDSDGIGRLVLDVPGKKVNTLSLSVLQELEELIDAVKENKDVRALVFTSAKSESFIAGADLSGFEALSTDKVKVENLIRTGHRIYRKMESLSIPTIASINGTCLGGGMELALACSFRIASDHPKTLLGLPEVTLGLIPAWGGTQRAPRLVGFMEGLELILSGKQIPAIKAWRIKLIDSIVRAEFLEVKTEEFIKECLKPEGREKILKRRVKKGIKTWLLEKNPLGRMAVAKSAKSKVLKQTKGHYPAPNIALNLITSSFSKDLTTGLEMEIHTVLSNWALLRSLSRNLLRLFFTSEALKKDPGAFAGPSTQTIERTGVIGAGIMGAAIAQLFSKMNYPVRMKDKTWELVGKGYGSAWSEYKALILKNRLGQEQALVKWQKIGGTVDYSGFSHVDIVVEAIVENLQVKQDIVKELEEHIPATAIIGTNTSSLTVEEIGSTLKHPERFIGLHFFNPVSRLPLVEVAPSSKTSQETVAAAVDFCRKVGKVPIVVKDEPGFLVNRIFLAGGNEILRMLEEGVPMDLLTKALVDFGMPKDPFAVFDDVGNDINLIVAQNLEKAYGERMKVAGIISAMNQRNLLGKKTGKGFYLYEKDKQRPNPQIKELVSGQQKNPSYEEIQNRVVFLMIDEAARCLQEQVIASAAYLDMALVMGIGFPPYRGGVLSYADDRGIEKVVSLLQSYEKLHGIRFSPCQKLVEMAKSGQTFYASGRV
jgi:3-hydroxyacyl-CoA dehydrogenase/enoyl-CoA hydratase/3-hydroxybutyryl-CoA epimerase